MDLRFSQFEVFTTTGSFFICLFFVCVFLEASDIEQELGATAAEAVGQQNLFAKQFDQFKFVQQRHAGFAAQRFPNQKIAIGYGNLFVEVTI